MEIDVGSRFKECLHIDKCVIFSPQVTTDGNYYVYFSLIYVGWLLRIIC